MIMENMEEKNPKNNSWVTPLHEAATEGHLEVCKLILENVPEKILEIFITLPHYTWLL